MNHRNAKPRGPLSLCPKCGMDSGRRVVSDTNPERYFVICDTCGFHTKGYSRIGSATYEWNKARRRMQNDDVPDMRNCI